jgi:hypothetical protein
MTVSWFVSQNQAGYGLSVAPQNQRESNNVEHASRSSVLLRVEVSWARVSQSDLKTAEARRWVVHVAPSRMLHRDQVEGSGSMR